MRDMREASEYLEAKRLVDNVKDRCDGLRVVKLLLDEHCGEVTSNNNQNNNAHDFNVVSNRGFAASRRVKKST
jgi:hypothetical protein